MVTAEAPVKSAVTDYAERVLSGEIVAGRLVRLACERHLRDLEDGHERLLRFDDEKAQKVARFFGFLRHSKGEWAGRALELRPWQAFILGSIFGWQREFGQCPGCLSWLPLRPADRRLVCAVCFGEEPAEPQTTGWYRRFRTAYQEVARKNGKTTLKAGVALYLAFFDEEPGAEVYAASTKKDQSRILWDEASRMVKAAPALKKRITVYDGKGNMNIPGTASKFEPLGADTDGTDGLNPHGCVVDELHAHKSRSMVDVLETATGARRQPLIDYITTAGHNRQSVCWEQREYGVRVLEGVIQDDSYFAYIATIDEGDDWTDPAVWIKANPNLGVSVKMADLETKCDKAKQLPSAQNAFKRLHLDIWTESAERWLTHELWGGCGGEFDAEELRERRWFWGLDLADTDDLAAFCMVAKPEDEGEPWYVVWRFWMPRENVRARVERSGVPYDVWMEAGFIKGTPGNVIDYDVIRADINALAGDFNLREGWADPWQAKQLLGQLEGDGLTVGEVHQGYAHLSSPSKKLEELLGSQALRHGDNPVAKWMAANVVKEEDAYQNIKPSKKKSSEKIDGIAALVMAIGAAEASTDAPSVYETRGLTFLTVDDLEETDEEEEGELE